MRNFVCVFGLIFLSSGMHAQDKSLIDSLEKMLATQQGKLRLKTLSDLAWEYGQVDSKRAENYAREELAIAQQVGDSMLVAVAANDVTTALYRQARLDEALPFAYRSLRLREKDGDYKSIYSSLNKLVNIYTEQVKLDSALKYGLHSLKLLEAAKDSNYMVVALNNIASIFVKEREWAPVREYSERAYAIAKKVNNLYGMGGAAGNLGVHYEQMNQLEKAIEWNEEASVIMESLGSWTDVATAANNLGFIYHKQGKLVESKAQYQKALEMATRIGAMDGVAHYSANLGGLANALKQHEEAASYFYAALAIADKAGIGRIQLQCYDGLVEALCKTGNPDEGYRFMMKYKDLRDSLYTEERGIQMAEMRTRFETAKKEQENEFLKKENELKEREKSNILFGSLGLIVLLTLAGVFYYRAYRRRQEANMQRELVRERELGLEAVFTATEEERKRIAKDLHDGIGQQLSGLKLGFEALKPKLEAAVPEETERLAKLTKVLDESAVEVRGLSHQMMPKALQENGLLPAIEDMLHKSLGISDMAYRVEHFKVEGQRFGDKVEVGLYRICQELVNNISKHSGASQVVVQFFKNKNTLVLIVEDNGRGFDSNAKREGIGLMNITSRLSTIHGEVTWEPGPQAGTVATVRIPVS